MLKRVEVDMECPISLLHESIGLTRVSKGFWKQRGLISMQTWQFKHNCLTSLIENGRFLIFRKCKNRVTSTYFWIANYQMPSASRLNPLYTTLHTVDYISGTIFCFLGLWTILYPKLPTSVLLSCIFKFQYNSWILLSLRSFLISFEINCLSS